MNQRVYLNGKLKLRNVGAKKLSLNKAVYINYPKHFQSIFTYQDWKILIFSKFKACVLTYKTFPSHKSLVSEFVEPLITMVKDVVPLLKPKESSFYDFFFVGLQSKSNSKYRHTGVINKSHLNKTRN